MDKSAINIATYNNCAQRYQDKFMDMDLYHDTFDRFLELLSPTQTDIFEIACGPGNIARYLLNKRADLNIDGTDLASNMIELAKVNVPEANFSVMDCREIANIDKQYDAIICGFCLPYITDEESEKLINDCAGLLKDGGILYVSTMEGDPADNGLKGSASSPDKLFMHYRSADWLTDTLKSTGFEVVDLQQKHYPQDNGGSMTDLFVFARKINS